MGGEAPRDLSGSERADRRSPGRQDAGFRKNPALAPLPPIGLASVMTALPCKPGRQLPRAVAGRDFQTGAAAPRAASRPVPVPASLRPAAGPLRRIGRQPPETGPWSESLRLPAPAARRREKPAAIRVP